MHFRSFFLEVKGQIDEVFNTMEWNLTDKKDFSIKIFVEHNFFQTSQQDVTRLFLNDDEKI